MKHIFIVNPTSAQGKAKSMIPAIEQCCKEAKLDYQIVITKKPKEAISIARFFGKNQDHVLYSVGGDGTLLEVVNGLVGGNGYLSVIPAGSGNDFYRMMKQEERPIHKIDVGKINDTYFLNSASIGLDAEVANNITKMKQLSIPSSLVYKASILYSYFHYHPITITHDIENQLQKQDVTIFTVCNGKFYGGGFPIAPHAEVDDGMFDVYLADALTKVQIPRLLYKLTKGTHETSSKVHKYQSDHISIQTKDLVVCNVDGEIIRGNSFHFQLFPKHLTYCEGHPKMKQLIKEKLSK